MKLYACVMEQFKSYFSALPGRGGKETRRTYTSGDNEMKHAMHELTINPMLPGVKM